MAKTPPMNAKTIKMGRKIPPRMWCGAGVTLTSSLCDSGSFVVASGFGGVGGGSVFAVGFVSALAVVVVTIDGAAVACVGGAGVGAGGSVGLGSFRTQYCVLLSVDT